MRIVGLAKNDERPGWRVDGFAPFVTVGGFVPFFGNVPG